MKFCILVNMMALAKSGCFQLSPKQRLSRHQIAVDIVPNVATSRDDGFDIFQIHNWFAFWSNCLDSRLV